MGNKLRVDSHRVVIPIDDNVVHTTAESRGTISSNETSLCNRGVSVVDSATIPVVDTTTGSAERGPIIAPMADTMLKDSASSGEHGITGSAERGSMIAHVADTMSNGSALSGEHDIARDEHVLASVDDTSANNGMEIQIVAI
ncbi:hypothetical protein V6N13_105243 [Hibiscus sabdariffa]